MSTIACDGRAMSGDGQVNREGMIVNTRAVKVVRAQDGSLIGTCGTASVGDRFVEWWNAGAKGKWEQGHEANALVLSPGSPPKLVFYGDCGYGNVQPIPQAIGSGGAYAMAAMRAGASTEKAVFIACEMDPHTGGKITTLRLSEDSA